MGAKVGPQLTVPPFSNLDHTSFPLFLDLKDCLTDERQSQGSSKVMGSGFIISTEKTTLRKGTGFQSQCPGIEQNLKYRRPQQRFLVKRPTDLGLNLHQDEQEAAGQADLMWLRTNVV